MNSLVVRFYSHSRDSPKPSSNNSDRGNSGSVNGGQLTSPTGSKMGFNSTPSPSEFLGNDYFNNDKLNDELAMEDINFSSTDDLGILLKEIAESVYLLKSLQFTPDNLNNKEQVQKQIIFPSSINLTPKHLEQVNIETSLIHEKYHEQGQLFPAKYSQFVKNRKLIKRTFDNQAKNLSLFYLDEQISKLIIDIEISDSFANQVFVNLQKFKSQLLKCNESLGLFKSTLINKIKSLNNTNKRNENEESLVSSLEDLKLLEDHLDELQKIVDDSQKNLSKADEKLNESIRIHQEVVSEKSKRNKDSMKIFAAVVVVLISIWIYWLEFDLLSS